MTTPRNLSDELLALVAARFRLLGDPTRLRLLEAVRNGEQSVGAIATAAETSQANASKHLATLLEAGIVTRSRRGNAVFYQADGRIVYLLIDAICSELDTQANQRRELLAAARPGSGRGQAP